MSEYNPPYTITSKILDLTSKISESLAELKYNNTQVSIPFNDGNGRIGRLWQSVMLYSLNPLFSSIPIESIVRDHQEEYYKALEEATEAAENTPFIEFMLEMILVAIAKVGKEVGNRVGNLTDNQQMIVQMMQENSKVSAKLLAEEVGISVGKIEENIAKLKKMGVIERVGGTRGHWEVK